LKVVILNNDFRVYWKERLFFLKQYLATRKIEFYAIEFFGKGSPYAFDVYNSNEQWWTCLFPDKSAVEISPKEVWEVLSSALFAINPDIIIAPSIVFYPGALGIRWAKKNNKKFIMFDDAMAGQVKRQFIVQWIKNLITKQADGFWLPSPNYHAGYAFLGPTKILFFYGFNCIDNQRFKAGTSNPMNHKTIICVARLVPIKNIDALIKAWAKIEASETGYKLVIIGTGPNYNNLTHLATALHLTSVEFLGTVPNDQLAAYYHKADAFILPSFSESWGLVVNEAMAAGLPVLLSDNINAAHCLLKEGENGFNFNARSTEDIENAILKFIRLSAAAKMQMSLNSLKEVDKLSYEKMGVQLTDALVKIHARKTKYTGAMAWIMINMWNGRYNTKGWDN